MLLSSFGTMAAEVGITEEIKTSNESPVVESGDKESVALEVTVKQKESAAKPKEKSGIRKRIKINVPGIISTDKSSNRPPRELLQCKLLINNYYLPKNMYFRLALACTCKCKEWSLITSEIFLTRLAGYGSNY